VDPEQVELDDHRVVGVAQRDELVALIGKGSAALGEVIVVSKSRTFCESIRSRTTASRRAWRSSLRMRAPLTRKACLAGLRRRAWKRRA
jgi:hypothetical protein